MKKLLSRLDWSYFYSLLGEGTLALTFVFYIILARLLGPERYEIFASAAALGAILSLFIQCGLPFLIQREVAANPEKGSKYTIQFILLEVLNVFPVLILLFPITQLLNYQGEGLIVCYLVVFAELCRQVKLTLRGVAKGMGWFRTETIFVAIERSAVVFVAGAVLLWKNNLVLVVGTLVLVRLLENLGFLYYLSRKLNVWRALNFNNLTGIYKIAFPFALSGVLWMLYYKVDVVMLKGMAETGEAGFYSASYQIVEIFSALPRVVFYVIFTRLARYHANEPEKVPEQIYKATRALLILVLPPIVIAGFFQSYLVELLYGQEYSYSVQSLGILIPNISVHMFGLLVQQFFLATQREKYLPPLLIFSTIINIISNAILIPFLGSVGAALCTLFSAGVLGVIGLGMISRIGYKKAGHQLQLISAMSLLLTVVPSLIMNGLELQIGIFLMIGSIASLVILMRPQSFLD
ncbi:MULTISPECIES: oligosaccharide flippase family protein [Okeania]|uniref:Flippase n=1 Tax=Okeania hirsuta TaxID=1458930 RepID=A0A3N6QHH3_9CYAN|nr:MULTISPECIES: oligosaccharide flippase family protein [Okeania]NES88781.1 oligosaccharide flippase family protein [Okeania sp. SIO2B9]NET79026.1 oligosaccharide flippase family protein [Okeania sp. SIO1F9]RQH12176.1 flippase [Okeania hirsuta]RQH28486.1 flippase [Okeania hirsuta]